MSLHRLANSSKTRKLHRILGLIAVGYVLFAVTSGLTHIIMGQFFPAPPPVTPNGVVPLEDAKTPLSALRAQLPPDAKVKAANIRFIQNKLYYQLLLKDQPTPLYFDAQTGTPADIDQTYAEQIARTHLDRDITIQSTDYVTAFNNEYLNIYRVLPVYRFALEGSAEERLYVSTTTGSVTHYLNKPRAIGQFMFTYLHKFSFIPNKTLRDSLLAFFALTTLAASLVGLFIWTARLKKR